MKTELFCDGMHTVLEDYEKWLENGHKVVTTTSWWFEELFYLLVTYSE